METLKYPINCRYFVQILLVLLLSGCNQPQESTWTDKDQAEWNAGIGLNNGPIYYGDKSYFEIDDIKLKNVVTRKELLGQGYFGHCKKAYSPSPIPKIVNYDTGETEPIEETAKEVIAYECQTIRKSDENPRTYTPLKWWMDKYYNGITQDEFNSLTGRGIELHDYSKPWP